MRLRLCPRSVLCGRRFWGTPSEQLLQGYFKNMLRSIKAHVEYQEEVHLTKYHWYFLALRPGQYKLNRRARRQLRMKSEHVERANFNTSQTADQPRNDRLILPYCL